MKSDYEGLKKAYGELKNDYGELKKEKEAGDRKGAEQLEKELARLREEN